MSDELDPPEPTKPSKQRSRWLEAALTIVAAQLLAVVLLYFGYTVALSLGVAAAVATVFLTRRPLWSSGLWFAARSRRLALAISSRLLDRRTYRFGLRSLLAAIFIIALVSAWFAYRQRAVSLERQLIHGRWAIIGPSGKPLVGPDGKQITIDFGDESYTVNPLKEPRWLDFHSPQGVMRGIYRWEGDELLVCQVSIGVERPETFFPKVLRLEAGFVAAGPVEVSQSTYRLRRLAD